MPFPITSPIGVLAILSGVCAFFFGLEKVTRWKFFQFIPPLIFIYLVPMILSNSGVLPVKSPVYDAIGTILLPMLLVLLMLKLNIRGSIQILGRGLGVMLFGTLGVIVGAPIGLLIVQHWLGPDAWKAFGSLSASWVGGSANLAAVSLMLHASGTEYGLAVFADTVITYAIWLPIMLHSKKYAESFARISRPVASNSIQQNGTDDAHRDGAEAPSTRDYIFLISVALLAAWLAESLAVPLAYLTSNWRAQPMPGENIGTPILSVDVWRILMVTTIGIACSFTRLSRIAGSHELAMALLYIFVARMGASAQLEGVAAQIVPFSVGALIWIFIHGCFCLLGAILFRTDIHTAAIASAANIGGAATATIVADYHKRSLLPAAILMALIGYALGTYTGYITAQICRYVSG